MRDFFANLEKARLPMNLKSVLVVGGLLLVVVQTFLTHLPTSTIFNPVLIDRVSMLFK